LLARVIDRDPVAEDVETVEGYRRLALSIRQHVEKPGGIILFTCPRSGTRVEALVSRLSRFLAQRDEKVLIVDARVTQPTATALAVQADEPVTSGLAEYLTFQCQELAEFTYPT